ATVARNSSRLRVLVEDLLLVAAADSAEPTVGLVPLDLRQVIEASQETLAELARHREDLQLRYDLPSTVVTVRGDAPSLERLIENLCSNAIKFTPEEGSVTVRLVQENAGASLFVIDTGIGIDEAARSQLFKRFFRAPEANSRAIPGSGLGLSVVQEILRQHGGTIEIDSIPNEGTTVKVWLAAPDPA
ncbi:MAG: ATP-binding protein, partial [Marmoricola sp.]